MSIKLNIKTLSGAEKKVIADISALLKSGLGKDYKPRLIALDYPAENIAADYVLPCFLLAKKLKKAPAEIALELAAQLTPDGLIEKVKASGPYLNFFVNRQAFTQAALSEIAKAKSQYGHSTKGKGKTVMVEYFSPNTNKPLTIGHVRNICLGYSISQILKFAGYKVIQATLYNDRGIAIAKAIVGYLKWGQGKTPKDAGLKPDHFVGSFYTQFCQAAKNNPNLDPEATQALQAWEEDRKDIKSVWQQLMAWVLEGFKQTINKLGVSQFNEEYYESEYYQSGKEVVEKGVKLGVFVKNPEGVTYAPLQKYGLADKIVLRPDDTSLYVTQDLHLAYLKDKYRLDSSVYVVGSEQDLYFKQLFKILELLGFKNASKYYHLSYGMIRLPSGKIKSREGLVKGTGADELMAELEELAGAEIKKRYADLPEKELNARAEQIALAALKFYILAVGPKTTMVFEPQKSIAFTGRTGPYLQYVYARINSIFEKTGKKVTAKVDFAALNDDAEFAVIRLLARYPAVIGSAVSLLDPSVLANYLFELAKAFSLFYEKLPVLQAQENVRRARLLLIHDVRIVLHSGLELLGIKVLEKM